MPTHRTRVVTVRFRPTEWQALRTRAIACGLPPSRYLREVALGAHPRTRPGADERAVHYHLARIGNNLHQLARHADSLPLPRSDLLATLSLVKTALETRR